MLTQNADLVLRYMFPEAKEGDWRIEDGQLLGWQLTIPQPTDEEINANEAAALAAQAQQQAAVVSAEDKHDDELAALLARINVLEDQAGITQITLDDVKTATAENIAAVISTRVTVVPSPVVVQKPQVP